MVDKKVKMAIIAGASRALAHKKVDSRATDEEILQEVSRETAEIIRKLDTE